MKSPWAIPNDPRLMTPRQSVRFMCKACNGTGLSRYHENADCDVCDGHGTILTTLERKP